MKDILETIGLATLLISISLAVVLTALFVLNAFSVMLDMPIVTII